MTQVTYAFLFSIITDFLDLKKVPCQTTAHTGEYQVRHHVAAISQLLYYLQEAKLVFSVP